MNRRHLLRNLAGAAAAATVSRAVGADRPPNFLIILADDLGAKELGCYGHPTHRTPRLDALAAQGTRFETCYATPLCSPTRVLLMTGRYGFRTGWYNLIGQPYAPPPSSPQYDLGQAETTFAEVLKTRGYHTALAGKWQLSGQVPTLVHDCGFDEYLMWAYRHNLPPGVTHTGAWEGQGQTKTARYWWPCLLRNGEYVQTTERDYGPDRFTDFTLDFIRRQRAEPWCVYYTSCLTHAPYDPTPDLRQPGQKTAKGFESNLEYLDHLIGRLVDGLDGLGLARDTMILFVGDNGTGGDGKGTVTEQGVRVPLIVRGPGDLARGGQVSRELVSVADFFPTLCELGGAALPTDRPLDGRSLVPTLRDGARHREWLFSYLRDQRMLRDERWLLEGNGRFYDCGDSRNGQGYHDVTGSADPAVVTARQRFDAILKDLPAPPTLPGQPPAQRPRAGNRSNRAGANP